MHKNVCATRFALALFLATTVLAAAEVRKEYRFQVRRHASISVVNQYGPISVKPTNGNQVVVNAVFYSDKVEVDSSQGGNHVSVVSHLLPGADADTGRVEYEVFVPADANVTMHSTTGVLHAERLHGDVILEGNTASRCLPQSTRWPQPRDPPDGRGPRIAGSTRRHDPQRDTYRPATRIENFSSFG